MLNRTRRIWKNLVGKADILAACNEDIQEKKGAWGKRRGSRTRAQPESGSMTKSHMKAVMLDRENAGVPQHGRLYWLREQVIPHASEKRDIPSLGGFTATLFG